MFTVPGSENAAQLDADIHLDSDPICNSAGCTQYLHPDSTTASYPMNYGVPNFGQDRQISDSIMNSAVAEKIVGHKWDWKEKKKPKQPQYPGAERGLDSDIVSSIANMKMVDPTSTWSLVQLDAEHAPNSLAQSDPICSSGGCD